MFRRQKLDQLQQKKQALVLESGVNRVTLAAELERLRSATGRASGALRSPRKLAVPAAILAAAAGFLFTRRRTRSLIRSAVWAAKWGVPAYRLWKSFSSTSRRRAVAERSN